MTALGLSGDQGVFVQPLWQGAALSYLVINDRQAPVDVVVTDHVGDCSGERLAGPWTIAARTHQLFSGSDVQHTFGRYSARFVDDIASGVDILRDRPPLAPLAPLAAEVTHHGANGSGGDYFAQLESDRRAAESPSRRVTEPLRARASPATAARLMCRRAAAQPPTGAFTAAPAPRARARRRRS